MLTQQTPPMADEHIQELTLQSLMSGRLDAAEQARVERHVDRCRLCQSLMAEAARAAAGSTDLGQTVVAGDAVGRYLILAHAGRGGMGQVYAAWDPNLDRKVALKLVAADVAADPDAHERLLVEARAVASVRHPNVIQIHDVGRVGTTVFVAMEFMDRGTLGAWLRRELPPAQIVALFVQAGRGLQAAHDVGLVHRDFKPDNVLLATGGEVRVTDFGLARSAAGMPTTGEFAEVAAEQTAAAGTPAYMAPEQLRGQAVTARSDQFAFAVALWEALSGQRPFDAETKARRLAAIDARKVQGERALRPAVRRVLMRALHPEPRQRHQDVAALLVALQRAIAPPKRAGSLALAAAVVGVVVWASASESEPSLCTDANLRWAGVWDAERKLALRESFVAIDPQRAERLWTRVEREVDTYVSRWSEPWAQTCAPGNVERQAQRRCLLALHSEVVGLSDGLAMPDDEVMSRALRAVTALGDPAACALATEVDTPPVSEIDAKMIATLTRVGGLRRLGRNEDAREHLETIERALHGRDAPAMLSRVRNLQGKMSAEAHQLDQARTQFMEAGSLAVQVDAPELAASAWISLMLLDGELRKQPVWAEHWESVAAATLRRVGPRSRMPAMFAGYRGRVLTSRGDWAGARDAFREAIARAESTAGADHPDAALARLNLAGTLNALGELDAAAAEAAAALKVLRTRLGEDHPDTASAWMELGANAMQRGQTAEAMDNYDRALTALRAGVGGRHGTLDSTLANVAITILGSVEPDYARAIALLEEAIELQRERGADPVLTDISRHQLARAWASKGDLERAAGQWTLAIDHLESTPPPAHPVLIRAHWRFGQALARAGEFGRARPHLARAVAVATERFGAEHAETQYAVAEAAYAEVLAGVAQTEPLRGVLAIDERAPLGEYSYRARLYLARALSLGEHGPSEEQERLLVEARARGAEDPRFLDELDAWLQSSAD